MSRRRRCHEFVGPGDLQGQRQDPRVQGVADHHGAVVRVGTHDTARRQAAVELDLQGLDQEAVADGTVRDAEQVQKGPVVVVAQGCADRLGHGQVERVLHPGYGGPGPYGARLEVGGE